MSRLRAYPRTTIAGFTYHLRPCMLAAPGSFLPLPKDPDIQLALVSLDALSGYWNINQLSIDYAFRPRLRSRLTLGGLAFPRKPWAFGGRVSHPSLATHACIRTRHAPRPSVRLHSMHRRSATTLPYSYEIRGFGV